MLLSELDSKITYVIKERGVAQMAITITPTSAKIDISINTSITAALALIRQAEFFAEGNFTKNFALKSMEEIRVALRDLRWESSTVDDLISKVRERAE